MKTDFSARCRGLFSAGDRVISATSGGADSMALLWRLHSLREELGITVCAAHFNHGLRGADADADEAFVRSFCEAHEIEFYSARADVASPLRGAPTGTAPPVPADRRTPRASLIACTSPSPPPCQPRHPRLYSLPTTRSTASFLLLLAPLHWLITGGATFSTP